MCSYSEAKKVRLTELCFVLQHANSRCLLSHHGYQQVEAYRIPSEKVIDLQDGVIQRGPEAAQGLIGLKDEALQEAFALPYFVKDLPVNTASSGRTKSAQSADN